MRDHRAAQDLLQRAIAGERLSDDDLQQALTHVATCEECARQFELDRTAACEAVEDDLPEAARSLREGGDVTSGYPMLASHLRECERCSTILAELARELEPSEEAPVDPAELFERALTAALADEDPLARERAAEGMTRLEHVGPAALAALVETAGEDEDEEVRAAALGALGLLARQPARIAGVTQLIGTAADPEEHVAVTGEGGISGRVIEEGGELRLSLRGLPPKFEHTKPIVAIPTALEEATPSVEWSAGQPGVVPATEAVSGGSLDVTLGRSGSGAGRRTKDLFKRVYLLDAERRRRRSPGED